MKSALNVPIIIFIPIIIIFIIYNVCMEMRKKEKKSYIYILVLYEKPTKYVLLIYTNRVLCIYDNNSDKAQCMPNIIIILIYIYV